MALPNDAVGVFMNQLDRRSPGFTEPVLVGGSSTQSDAGRQLLLFVRFDSMASLSHLAQ